MGIASPGGLFQTLYGFLDDVVSDFRELEFADHIDVVVVPQELILLDLAH